MQFAGIGSLATKIKNLRDCFRFTTTIEMTGQTAQTKGQIV